MRYLLFIIASVALFWWQCHVHPLINEDGVTYLQAAGAYVQHGVKATIAVGAQARWPFYSMLIGEFSRITAGNLLFSAYVIDCIFVCLSGLLFVLIARALSDHRAIECLAMLVWLSWHAYTKWWPQIVRDHGGLTFFLLSIYCLLYFYEQRTLRAALYWAGSMLLMTLFRFEAMIFWALVPLFMITRFKDMAKLYALLLIAGVMSVTLFFMGVISTHSLRFEYILNSALHYLSITQHTFEVYRAAHATMSNAMIIAHLVASALGDIADMLTPVGLLGLVALCVAPVRRSSVMMSYFIVSFFVPTAFYSQNLFLNDRYLLPLAVTILLIVTPALAYFIQKRYAYICLVVAMLYNAVASLHRFGHQSDAEYQAGRWLQMHYPNKTILTNTKVILYYASVDPAHLNGHVLPSEEPYDLLVLKGQPKDLDAYRDRVIQSFDAGNHSRIIVVEAKS